LTWQVSRGIENTTAVRHAANSEVIHTLTAGGLLQLISENANPDVAEINYSKRVDFVTDSLIYRGEAVIGATESEAAWRIRKILIGEDGDVTEIWANGADSFINVWNDRASLSYQ
jgi:hypothetical protein